MRTPAVLLAYLLVAGMATPARAFHTVFDFTVDRVAVDGNAFGPFDGTPDFVDEFTDLSNWYTPYGTSSVSDGRLHVQSPGRHFPGPDGTTLDLSEVASTYPGHGLHRGAGNFTATAVFDPIIPPEGHFYHFTIYTFGGVTYFNELFGIDIQTSGGETRIEQHLVILDLANGIYQTVQTEARPITAADVTGQLHFRVGYDDAAGTIASAFSLDGGATFTSPFAPAPIFTQGRTNGQLIFGADPRISSATTTTTTSPTTTTTTTLPLGSCLRTQCTPLASGRLDLRARAKGQSLAWSWWDAPAVSAVELGDPLGATRYALCIRDGAAALVYRSELPGGGLCDGRPCWRKIGDAGFRYRRRDAGAGLASLVLAADGPAQSRGAARAGNPALLAQPLPLALPVTVQLEADTGACWSATLHAGDVIENGATRFRAARR